MAPDPLLGRTLGKFHLEAKLGQGGMGAVYRAVDTVLERTVALKVLPAHLAGDEEARARFLREARRAAQLTHAHIVQVYDVDEADDHPYIAMQFMAQGSLQELLDARGPLPPTEAARVVAAAARGLARAHKAGVVHRDVKPANILLDEEDGVRLGDFGLVKHLGGGDQPLTATGTVLGTPHYMAPEQCEGLLDIDARADVYALGVVLYQCLSGVLPARGSTPLQIIHHRLREDPPPLDEVQPGLPRALVSLVEALLVRDRDRRTTTAAAAAEALEAFLHGAAAPTAAVAGAAPAGAPLASATAETVAMGPEAEPSVAPAAGRSGPRDLAAGAALATAPPGRTQRRALACCLVLAFVVVWVGGAVATRLATRPDRPAPPKRGPADLPDAQKKGRGVR